jgi:putative ABC transport system substrate-binding protein
MKKLKKLSVGALILAMGVMGLSGCNPSNTNSNTNTSTEGNPWKIGVVQLIEHAALDASYQGFLDSLKEEGLEEGKDFIVDFHNAQGEQANAQTIATKLVNDKNDLILAIATPAAQAAANATDQIPILVTAVTDPQDAKLVQTNEKPGTNVSGTSDLTPVKEQIQLLVDLVPDAKTVGLLYASGEANSVFQINLAKNELDALGLKYVEATVSSSNEIQQVAQSLVGKVDALYSPTDNMIANAMPLVVQVMNEAKIPFIVAEEGMFENGALATFGINYYNLGKLTGKQAVRVLKEGANPAEMPIEYLKEGNIFINEALAEELGITIPQDLLDRKVND